jgi:hypothetical protein
MYVRLQQLLHMRAVRLSAAACDRFCCSRTRYLSTLTEHQCVVVQLPVVPPVPLLLTARALRMLRLNAPIT